MGSFNVAMNNILNVKGQRWFLDYRNSSLMCIDNDFQRVYVKIFFSKGEFADYPKVYGDIVYFDGKIIAVPEAPIPIAVYDIEKEEVEYIEYAKNNTGFLGKVFSGVVIYEDRLFFIPCCYESIIEMNRQNKLEYYSLKKYFTDEQPSFLWSGYINNKSGIWFSTFIGNKVLHFDCNSKETKEIVSLKNLKGIAGLFEGPDEDIIIVPVEAKKLYRYSLQDESLKELDLFPQDYVSGTFSFARIIKRENTVYLLPREANKLIIIENGLSVRSLDFDRNQEGGYFEKYYPCSNIEYNEKEWKIFTEKKGLICCDENFNVLRKQDLTIDMTYAKRNKKTHIQEDEIWNLEWLINQL